VLPTCSTLLSVPPRCPGRSAPARPVRQAHRRAISPSPRRRRTAPQCPVRRADNGADYQHPAGEYRIHAVPAGTAATGADRHPRTPPLNDTGTSGCDSHRDQPITSCSSGTGATPSRDYLRRTRTPSSAADINQEARAGRHQDAPGAPAAAGRQWRLSRRSAGDRVAGLAHPDGSPR
jgi:hypothetical protein